MAAGVQLGGADALKRLSKRADNWAASGVLGNAVEDALASVVPIATDAVSRGAQRLPQRGGLAKRVAKTQVNAKTFRGPNLIGVRLTAARNALKDPNAVNRGRVRRPTYGHKPYVIQLVPTGFYSDPLFDLKPEVRRRLEAAKREAISKF